MFGNTSARPLGGPRGTSYKNADRLIKDSEVILRVAGTVIESELEWQEENLIRTADFYKQSQLQTDRLTTETINEDI